MSILDDAWQSVGMLATVDWNDIHDRLDGDQAVALHMLARTLPKIIAALEAADALSEALVAYGREQNIERMGGVIATVIAYREVVGG